MLAKRSPEIGKAVAIISTLSADEQVRLEVEAREKARMDWVSRMDGAREAGEKNKALEIARALYKKGIAFDVISETTGLTETEILELKQ